MSFQAILQALEGEGLKFIDVTTILSFFILFLKKTVTKFARLQTLKVIYTFAWKNNIGRGLLFTYQYAAA